jgi:hypothetical protein
MRALQLIGVSLALLAVAAREHDERELFAQPLDVATDSPTRLVPPDVVRLLSRVCA